MEKKIFIGSTNKSKISHWKNVLSDFDVVSPYDMGIYIKVEENDYSVFENSQKKSISWAKASGLLTLSDDSGFYLNDVKDFPGAAVKTWGGMLPEDRTDEEFIEVFKREIQKISDKSGYFEEVITLTVPGLKPVSFTNQTHGYLDLSMMDGPFESGYPLANVFIANDRAKTWKDMTLEESRSYASEFNNKVILEIKKMLCL